IVGVVFPSESGENTALGRKLVRGGLISEENWRKAFRQHTEGLQGIEKILVSNGLVSKEDMTAALRLLTFDAIYGLFKWKGGSFRFEAMPVSYDQEFVEPLASEYLLLDVLRMVDEWPMIAERFPSFDLVLQKTNALASLEVLNGTQWEKSRTFQMEVIYDLLDGQRSIKEIIEQSFVEEFETCKCLMTLMDAGLVEAAASEKGKSKKEKRGGEGLRFSKYLPQAGALILVGAVAAVLLIQFVATRGSSFPFHPREKQGWSILQESRKKVEERSAKSAQEILLLDEKR
ncbi:MAG TPA: DUF4388 domain-containing protein, partial [Thermodesulfobacteriota bacterium]|nr:DUF4388 domain-containing protein [Thermodesulfobacteriota bacterium]